MSPTLLCPGCGIDLTHVTGTRPVREGDDWFWGIGHEVILEGWCEGGHEFEIAFVQHKGETGIFAHYRDVRPSGPWMVV